MSDFFLKILNLIRTLFRSFYVLEGGSQAFVQYNACNRKRVNETKFPTILRIEFLNKMHLIV
jgi:hypothetical protein